MDESSFKVFIAHPILKEWPLVITTQIIQGTAYSSEFFICMIQPPNSLLGTRIYFDKSRRDILEQLTIDAEYFQRQALALAKERLKQHLHSKYEETQNTIYQEHHFTFEEYPKLELVGFHLRNVLTREFEKIMQLTQCEALWKYIQQFRKLGRLYSETIGTD